MAHLARDPRGYPILATVNRYADGANFGAINEGRKVALAVFDWCGACGLPIGDESRWEVVPASQPVEAKEILVGEMPMHEICAHYAAQVCPHLAVPGSRFGDDLRKGIGRPDEMRIVGYRRFVGVSAQPMVPNQGRETLLVGLGDLVSDRVYRKGEEISRYYTRLLASETLSKITPAEWDLIRLFNTVGDDDNGQTVVGAALMAGGVFDKSVRAVVSQHFKRSFNLYATIAGLIMERSPEPMKDPATDALRRYVMERTEFPAFLRHLQTLIPQMVRQPPSPPSGSARNVPCPCGSGKKAKKCHPAGYAAATR